MQNSKFAPLNFSEYGAKDLNASFKGINFVAAAGETTTNDLEIVDDMLIDGGVLITIGAALGDSITCQVIDKDNIFGYGYDTVLGQYITDWYMNPNSSLQVDFTNTYPAKLYAGLYLRILYTSVGTSDVNVILNYKLHKVLW